MRRPPRAPRSISKNGYSHRVRKRGEKNFKSQRHKDLQRRRQDFLSFRIPRRAYISIERCYVMITSRRREAGRVWERRSEERKIVAMFEETVGSGRQASAYVRPIFLFRIFLSLLRRTNDRKIVDRNMRTDHRDAGGRFGLCFAGIALSAIIRAISGWCMVRLRLRVGLESRVAGPERPWTVQSVSNGVLNVENRVLERQLSCQIGSRLSRACPILCVPDSS
jgi:hypothetical protein